MESLLIILLFSWLSAAYPVILIPLVGLLILVCGYLLILKLQEWFERLRAHLPSARSVEGVLIHAAPIVMLVGAAGLAVKLLLVGP